MLPIMKKLNRRHVLDQDGLNYGDVKIQEPGERNKTSGGCSVLITLLLN